MSADPLAVHRPGRADLNLYAYVTGATLKSVDPLGLEGHGTSKGAAAAYVDFAADTAGDLLEFSNPSMGNFFKGIAHVGSGLLYSPSESEKSDYDKAYATTAGVLFVATLVGTVATGNPAAAARTSGRRLLAGVKALGRLGRGFASRILDHPGSVRAIRSVAGRMKSLPRVLTREVWRLPQTVLGKLIEAILAGRDYKTWQHVGAAGGGKNRLTDFEKGNDLVSMATHDAKDLKYLTDKLHNLEEAAKRSTKNSILDVRVRTKQQLKAVKQGVKSKAVEVRVEVL